MKYAVYMRYHMFNYTNADTFIQNNDKKAILDEYCHSLILIESNSRE